MWARGLINRLRTVAYNPSSVLLVVVLLCIDSAVRKVLVRRTSGPRSGLSPSDD